MEAKSARTGTKVANGLGARHGVDGALSMIISRRDKELGICLVGGLWGHRPVHPWSLLRRLRCREEQGIGAPGEVIAAGGWSVPSAITSCIASPP